MLVLLHVACPTDGGLIDVLCQGRQTALPHLTSPEAESILAQACENESNNAKRMRMGLEPLPAHSVTDFRLLYNLYVYVYFSLPSLAMSFICGEADRSTN